MSQLHVVPLHRRTVAALSAVSLVGVIAFFWPFFVSPQSVAADHATDAPYAEKISYWTTPQKQCVDGSGDNCTAYNEWVDKWQQIKG